jgi:tripartite-type tricarboxylate transporter receptor subunit TctC
VTKLNALFNVLLGDRDVMRQLAAQGIEAARSASPEEVTAFVRDELPRWEQAVRLSGARID